MRRRLSLVPAVILGAGVMLLGSARRQESARLPAPLRTLPLAFAGYQGQERQIDSVQRRVAGMSDYVFRVYQRDSAGAFSLYVGYYANQTTGRTIHSPRNCLPGAGWQVVESGPAELVLGDVHYTVNRYVLADGPQQALVYYWYQGRGRVAWSEYRVKWDLMRDAMRRGRTEESLVRIVVPLRSSAGMTATDWTSRLEEAEAIARQAAREIIPAVARVLPSWDRTA